MKVHKLDQMIRGWFIGDFHPAALQSKEFEVAIKFYSAGEYEHSHVHRVATELTAVVSGNVMMNGIMYGPGEIITIEPEEATDFSAVTDTITVVVKTPSIRNDKFEKV